MKNKISDFRNVNKKSGVNYYCCRKAKPRSTLQHKQWNGAGSCNIHGTSPSSAKAVDVIGSGKMDVPRSDGTNGDGEDGRDGDGVVVEKCKEEVWQTCGDNG